MLYVAVFGSLRLGQYRPIDLCNPSSPRGLRPTMRKPSLRPGRQARWVKPCHLKAERSTLIMLSLRSLLALTISKPITRPGVARQENPCAHR
jgi:hypothetical protein